MTRHAAAAALLLTAAVGPAADSPKYAEVRVIDADTRRGVPLVEVVTTNHVRYVTDNAGRVAFDDPEQFGREVFFTVTSHGYEVPKDGFGFRGVRVKPEPGKVVEIAVKRTILAERLCRLTGEGRYRDTLLLGHKAPIDYGSNPGRVAGQDSVQVVEYKGERRWFWGDTGRMSYPLGLFRTAGAKTPLKVPDVSNGIAFDYFTDPKTGFARAMVPLAERPEGVIWVDGVCVVPDEKGHETLVCHYSRRKGLAEQLEHGIGVYDDKSDTFVPKVQLPKAETWRFPNGHPFLLDDGRKWLMCGDPAPVVRVPATLAAVLDPKQYQAFTPLDAKREAGPWRWQKELPPLDAVAEYELVQKKSLRAEDARFTPTGEGAAVKLHRGTVRWNEFRKRWVMIATQVGGKPSNLGEVWYAEADQPTGPFTTAVKVLTHDRMSFYNPVHHPFLDRDGGRTIHFEGTYTADFSGNPNRTPRYEYNQILYHLRLDSPALKPAQPK